MPILNNKPLDPFGTNTLFNDIQNTNAQIQSMNIPQQTQPMQEDPMVRRQRAGNMMLALSDVLRGQDPSQGVMQRQKMLQAQAQQSEQQNLKSNLNASIDALDIPETQKSLLKLLPPEQQYEAIYPTIKKQQDPMSYREYALTDKTPTREEYRNWMIEKEKAKGTVIKMGAEEEQYIKSLAKLGETDITESRKIATTSRELIPRLQTAQILLQNPDFVTGPLTEKFLPLKKLYNDLTGQDQTEVSGQELFQALANYTVPRMRPPGSGATSDFEANLFSTATIGLGKSKESNELLVATMIQQAKREQKLLKEKEKYYLKNKGNTVGFEQYLEENNLVPPLYQQINLQSQDIGEFYDKGLIRNGEAYIDMTDPNFPKLTVFRIADFD